MKCKNCEHFSFEKCVKDKCLGGCDLDPKNRTVNLEDECILEIEDWG